MSGNRNVYGYVICSVCGIHQTKKVSGICSRCERQHPVQWKQCQMCGLRKTKDPTGICSDCRKRRYAFDKTNSDTRLDDALADARRACRLLELKKAGASFSQIGRELGLSKSSAYAIYTRLIGSPMISVIDTDGAFLDVSDYYAGSTKMPPRIIAKRNESDDSSQE